ncbi:MAG: hypothetical protein R3325_16785 [Thermoanaerobaculia bacterium]|nr:hypothetical protein [Thermoanaerobaculia bacterium]
MRSIARRLLICVLSAAFLAGPAAAILTFTQLDDDVFVVSHRVKVIGSRGKAMRMVYTKAASLCVAAGFTHYQVLSQESEAAQEDEAANASVRVRYFVGDGDDRISCQAAAEQEYVQEARAKLAHRGYQRPDPLPAPGAAEPAAAASPCPGGCSLRQIAAMARAGLGDEQIEAACAEDASAGEPEG